MINVGGVIMSRVEEIPCFLTNIKPLIICLILVSCYNRFGRWNWRLTLLC